MSYFNKEQPTCKYCSTDKNKTQIKFKKKDDGKWAVTNMDGTPHDRTYCDQMKIKNQQPMQQQPTTKPISNYVGGTSTFSATEEPKTQGVTIFSLHVTISELRREIKELRKQIETTASIMDSMAQKQDLLIQRVGYPKPEPVVKGTAENMVFPTTERQKAYEENSKKFDEVMTKIEKVVPAELSQERARKEIEEANNKLIQKIRAEQRTTDESGVLLKDGQEVKAVQRHLSVDEINREMENKAFASKEVINPMRVAPEPQQQEDIMQWQNLSEAFLCVSCEGKFHNGFHKMGTRLCPACKDKIEANESEDRDDRSDVNQEFNRVSRSIEEINDDL